MGALIKSIKIENFRGIQSAEISSENLNIFIGDNGTNKTSILEAINFAFSPSFLSGRIKSTDFYKGTDNPIKIEISFNNDLKIKLPDGYTTQEVNCDKILLTIKKREKKSPGKVLSDMVTIEHIVIPKNEYKKSDKKGNEYWSLKRQSGTEFKFNERLLSFNVFESEEIPRSFYFNKERDKQLYKGFSTSFSSVIDDFNWRFLKQIFNNSNNDIFESINQTEEKIISHTKLDEHDVIKEFSNRINEFGLEKVSFSFIDKGAPFDQVFMSKTFEKINLPTKYMGSGIEMIYSLSFIESMASLSRENLIILIDEPELHLHPKFQEKLAEHLLSLSKNSKYQIFITTHSPIFFKTLVNQEKVKSIITKKGNDNIIVSEYKQKSSIFPWGLTWGEINFFAYDYSTVEFHNELYGYLQELSENSRCNELDEWLYKNYSIPKNKKWIREKNGQFSKKEDVTLITFIRNKIHHPENKTMQSEKYTPDELKESILKMIEIIQMIKNKESYTVQPSSFE